MSHLTTTENNNNNSNADLSDRHTADGDSDSSDPSTVNHDQQRRKVKYPMITSALQRLSPLFQTHQHKISTAESLGLFGRPSRKASKKSASSSTDSDKAPSSYASNNKKIIVLDLDECLIHTQANSFESAYPITLTESRDGEVVWMAERPFLKEFLAFCHEHFESVYIFTASEECYAKPIVEHITIKYGLPNISGIFSRNDCNLHQSSLPIKDLSKVCPDLSKVFLVDDNLRVTRDWPFNSIRVSPYVPSAEDQTNDNELIQLLPLLQNISRTRKDVRKYMGTIYFYYSY